MSEGRLTITIYDATIDAGTIDEAASIYREAYAEPPYLEDESQLSTFLDDTRRRSRQPNFRLIIARLDQTPLGFALGHQLLPDSRWWEGSLDNIPPDATAEYPGRTFAVIELAIRMPYRRRGLGRRLHAHLTADLSEERLTLLVRPDAEPALAAYSQWGYHSVGHLKPFEDAPIYLAMLRPATYH